MNQESKNFIISESLGNIILQELCDLRKDLKTEIQVLNVKISNLLECRSLFWNGSMNSKLKTLESNCRIPQEYKNHENSYLSNFPTYNLKNKTVIEEIESVSSENTNSTELNEFLLFPGITETNLMAFPQDSVKEKATQLLGENQSNDKLLYNVSVNYVSQENNEQNCASKPEEALFSSTESVPNLFCRDDVTKDGFGNVANNDDNTITPSIFNQTCSVSLRNIFPILDPVSVIKCEAIDDYAVQYSE